VAKAPKFSHVTPTLRSALAQDERTHWIKTALTHL